MNFQLLLILVSGMLFSEKLLQEMDPQWKEYYLAYGLLKEHINQIIKNKPESEKHFTKMLDKEWNKYYQFVNQLIENIKTQDISTKKSGQNIIMEILRVNDFVKLNQEGFRKIIKKHDKNSPFKLKPAWNWKMNYNPISKLFDVIKSISNLYNSDGEEGEKLHADSFKRKSIKYWVKKENIIPVIAHILPYLPIFIWDKDINDHIYQKISSTYFDNHQLEMYNFRIDKNEGSKLIRIRWYGDDDEQDVFIERKVHHDNWTLRDSSKDRFTLPSNQVMPFLRGDIEVDNELANEIQDIVQEKKIYPKVRTQYDRIAFQLPHSNRIRISLDINLRMIREKTDHFAWHTEEDKILHSDIFRFPYAVLEVKLSNGAIENPPEWVSDLMNSSLVLEQPFFSKFGHASWTFFTSQCQKVPAWIASDPKNFVSKEKAMEEVNQEVIINIDDDPQTLTNRKKGNNIDTCVPNLFNRKKKDVPVVQPIRIEPKTFFANERTYLQWFNAAVFVATAGLALIGLDSKAVGILLVIISAGIVCYSLHTYYKRNTALINRQGTGYHDIYGPMILSVVMISAFIFSAIFEASRNKDNT